MSHVVTQRHLVMVFLFPRRDSVRISEAVAVRTAGECETKVPHVIVTVKSRSPCECQNLFRWVSKAESKLTFSRAELRLKVAGIKTITRYLAGFVEPMALSRPSDSAHMMEDKCEALEME